MIMSYKTSTSTVNRNRSITAGSLVGAAIAALLVAPLVEASPVVNGSEISWPDNGWYQVQSADGLANICEGTRSCLVEPGRYIVINHTTGKRFTNIHVPGEPVVQVVTTDGNTISWPDDGWYQVQSASTYASICQGGRSCTVEVGTYIVINHTTGERFEDIAVVGNNNGGNPSQVTIDGNTISWPDDGWYQVQSADTFESFCEGGSGCAVPAGVYIVINHTTGMRFTDVVVSGSDVIEPSPDTDLALDTLSNDLISEMAGYQLEQNAAFAPDLAVDIIASNTGLVMLDASQFVVDDRGSAIVQPTERTQYACAEGGTMTLENGLLEINESSYSHSTEYALFDFDNCQAPLDAGVPISDTYEINGRLTTLQDSVSGTRFSTGKKVITYVDFDLRSDSGVVFSADAQIDTEHVTTNDTELQRAVSISQYDLQLGGGDDAQPTTSISNSTLTQRYSSTASGARQSYSLNVDGRISGGLTNEVEVSITSVSPLTRTLGLGPLVDENVPFSGQLQLSATDGTELTINANPEVDEDQSLLVDYRLLSLNGELSETIGARFIDLPFEVIDQP